MLKKTLLVLLVLFILCGVIGYKFYGYIFNPNITLSSNQQALFIKSKTNLEDLIKQLSDAKILKDTKSFEWVADKMQFKNIKPGKYIIQNNWNNKDLVSLLRSGRQSEVKLTFNNVRTIEELAGAISKIMEADSLAFLDAFLDEELLNEKGLNKATALSLFIPNTYQVYWSQEPEKVVNRLIKEHEKFWNPQRLEQAKALELKPEEVYTLASIVQKETNVNSEKPTIAGVYLNRLKKNILLQADPTVVFAVGDFGIRRVLNKHLEFDSPYNTYMYEGLPPGPIFMPDISSIDAVLKREKHNYLYFCASPDNSGKHQFAKTLTQHNNNANKYRRWLNKQRIYK